MALHKGSTLSFLVAAAALVGLGTELARGQNADKSLEALNGSWCDEDHGCTRWWTLYTVEVTGGNKIAIKYRDTEFVVFGGKITGQDAKSIEGFYTPPPEECSGRPRSEREKEAQDDRMRNGSEGEVEAQAGKAEATISEMRTSRSRGEKEDQAARLRGGSAGRLEAVARETNGAFGAKPASEGKFAGEAKAAPSATSRRQGKFVRMVDGLISADAGRITLNLPALPVLDHTCSVKDQLAAGPLKLVKQDALVKQEPREGKPRPAQ